MSTSVDPLRSTLDHLALDPRARTDRPYLITMLRRLGYSEAEIAAYLGEAKPEPAPEPMPEMPAAPAREPLPDDDDERVIELEYTGPGLRDFQLVVPVDATEFELDDPLGLGAGLEAGSEVIEGDPDDDELDAFLSGEGAVNFDDEFAADDDIPEAESDRDNEEVAVRDMDEDLGGDDEDRTESFDAGFDDDSAMEQLDTGDDDEFNPEMDPNNPVGESLAETLEDPDLVRGVKLVEFKGVAVRDATVRPLTAEEKAALAAQDTYDDALQAGWSAEAEEETPEPSYAEEEPAAEQWTDEPSVLGEPYAYGDWILHSREQQRADGSWHRVYFFAKGTSPNGEPSPMPEGYEVGVNERTGLPYLRRSAATMEASPDEPTADAWPEAKEPEAAAKKRVRMRRVQADSPEEAEAQLRGEGRNVLGTMPVDIQEHEEDD